MTHLDAYCRVPSMWNSKSTATHSVSLWPSLSPILPLSVSSSKFSAATSKEPVPILEKREAALKRSTGNFNDWISSRKTDNDHVRRLTLTQVVGLWRDLRSQGVPAGSQTKLMQHLRARLLGNSTYWRIVYEEEKNATAAIP